MRQAPLRETFLSVPKQLKSRTPSGSKFLKGEEKRAGRKRGALGAPAATRQRAGSCGDEDPPVHAGALFRPAAARPRQVRTRVPIRKPEAPRALSGTPLERKRPAPVTGLAVISPLSAYSNPPALFRNRGVLTKIPRRKNSVHFQFARAPPTVIDSPFFAGGCRSGNYSVV